MCVRTFFVACLAVLSPLAAGDDTASGFQKPTAAPAAEATSIELPMELLASRPLIRVKINGQGPFGFLLDPEATQTLIDARLVETLKLVPLKYADGTSARLVDLELGKSSLTNVVYESRDLSRVVPELGPSAQPRGVLSLSAWPDQLVTLDYTKWRVTIEPGALSDPDAKATFALGPTPQLFVALSIGERTFRCHVDPLYPGGLLLPADSLLEFPLAEPARDDGAMYTRRGLTAIRLARLETEVMVGDFTFKTPQVQFGGSGHDAILGWQWLADFSLTYDVSHGRVRLDQPKRSTASR